MSDPFDETEAQSMDPVNHPAHYKSGGIETIDVLEAKLSPEEFQGYCLGNALKYLTRRHYKGKPFEDMQKAHWYLTRALSCLDGDGQHNPPSSSRIVNLNPDPALLTEAIKALENLGYVLITTYPGQKTHNEARIEEEKKEMRTCIQPGCVWPSTHDRLYCLDHRFSKGKSLDKVVPDGK